jgi:peptide/nickel transport system substrate-binding protein
VAAVHAGACGRPRDELSEERRRALVVGVPAPPESPNPYLTTSTLGLWLGDLLFLRLGREQADFVRHPPAFTPGLAERWDIAAGGREIVFHLDPRARWSDGEPVTAEDVVFTWKMQVDPDVAWTARASKQEIESVEALDGRRVRFRFRRPSPYALMDAIEGNILPAHRLRGIAGGAWERVDWKERLVYSGPFTLERWEPPQSIVVAANPRYMFEGRPRIARLELRVIPEEAARAAQLLAGEIDFVDDLSSEDSARACAEPRLRCEAVADLYYAYIGWNTAREPFGDARVRRALGMAIDRRALVAQALGGAGRPAAGPILSFMWVHDPAVAPLPHDPAGARRLLEQAGFRDGDGDGVLERGGRPLSFELDIPHGSPLRERVAVRVRSDFEKVGARADILPLERALFSERHRRGDFDAYVSAWAPATRIDLTPQFHSASIGVSLNYVRLADPDLDALIERARAAADFEALVAGWRAVERRVVELQPYAFLFEKDRLLAIDRRFRNAAFDLRGPLATVEEWDVEEPR